MLWSAPSWQITICIASPTSLCWIVTAVPPSLFGGKNRSVARRLVPPLLALVALVAFAAPAAPARAQTAADPALDVPQATLAAALHCPATFSHPSHEPVLLVHGTFATDQENWGFNYDLVLPKLGYDVCTVTLPNRSLGDIQVSSEYVVYAIEHMAAASGRQ